MRKVYSAENLISLNHFKFALDAADIKYLVKNEYTQSSVGETPFNELWPELWVINNDDETAAKAICQQVEQKLNEQNVDWTCSHCGEKNASSFELCWQCQALAPE